ncbi:MAG: hypothetical protein ACYC8T_04940 [Myxococcaceae bacterium]
MPPLFRHAGKPGLKLELLISVFELRTAVVAEILALAASRAGPSEIERCCRALGGVAMASTFKSPWYDAVREEMEVEFLLADIAGSEALMLQLTGIWDFFAQAPEVMRLLHLEHRMAEARSDRLEEALRSRDEERVRSEARACYFATHLKVLVDFSATAVQPPKDDEYAKRAGVSPGRVTPVGEGPLHRAAPLDWTTPVPPLNYDVEEAQGAPAQAQQHSAAPAVESAPTPLHRARPFDSNPAPGLDEIFEDLEHAAPSSVVSRAAAVELEHRPDSVTDPPADREPE